MEAHAHFETSNPSRYLEMLCRHFGRKVDVQNDATKGWIQFPFGRCDLNADHRYLKLHASAESQARLDEVVQVMSNHLERFAFRESPVLVWQAVSTRSPNLPGRENSHEP